MEGRGANGSTTISLDLFIKAMTISFKAHDHLDQGSSGKFKCRDSIVAVATICNNSIVVSSRQ